MNTPTKELANGLHTLEHPAERGQDSPSAPKLQKQRSLQFHFNTAARVNAAGTIQDIAISKMAFRRLEGTILSVVIVGMKVFVIIKYFHEY